MHPTELLAKQHQDLLALLDELDFTGDAIERTRLIARGAELLKIHSAVNEEVFYPALRNADALAVDDGLAAQRAIDTWLDEVVGAPTAANVKVLREMVEQHLTADETRLFPIVEALDDAAADTLAEHLRRYADAAEDETLAGKGR
ncbi:MAG: hemerythrin domain-containing protein [bacterium]